MKKNLFLTTLIIFWCTSLYPANIRNFNSIDDKRSFTIYAGFLLDDGVDGITAGLEYFQQYKYNLHLGGSLAYTLGEFVLFGGSDVDYLEITPSARLYRIIPSIAGNEFFLQGGISYNDIDHNNGDNETGIGFKIGIGGVAGNREYLMMYNYIDVDGEDRKYFSITLGYFFF